MKCGITYTKDFIVPCTDTILKLEELCEGHVGSCRTKGYKYVYKYPDPVEFTTCFELSGSHYHGLLETSSDLFAPDSPGQYFYATEGSGRIPKQIAKNLGLKLGNKIVIRQIKPQKASEILLEPLFEDQIKPVIPKLVHVGLEIPNKSSSVHPIYGGVFFSGNIWKIIEINSNKQLIPFAYSRKTTKVQYLAPRERVLPINLYKFHAEPGIIHKINTIKKLIPQVCRICKDKCGIWLQSMRGCGKRALTYKIGSKIGYSIIEVSMYDYIILKDFEELLLNQRNYSILHIRQFPEALELMAFGQDEIINKVKDLIKAYLDNPSPQVLFLSSSNSSSLPGAIRNLFVPVSIPLPSPEDRDLILRALKTREIPNIIEQTSGKTIEELIDIANSLQNNPNIDQVLKKFKTTGIPNVKWEDIGGLIEAKQEIIDTIQLPLLHPEHFILKPRSGLLLYGPPGTGKTLLAKAIATECTLNFIPVKGPELLNMYVGESEKNIRELFDRARSLQPCVLFFDELDSLAPKRGQGSDSGVMDRIVAQLLTEIDGLQNSVGLFVIGATNRPDLLDPALLRPGRFDKAIYLGISSDSVDKLKIFEALTRKFNMDGVDLLAVAQACQGFYSGADIYAVCSQALSLAYKDKASEIEELLKNYNEQTYYEQPLEITEFCYQNPDLLVVTVNQNHFLKAAAEISPNLSEEEIKKYKYISK